MYTTNYFNTFIEVAEDCPVNTAKIPVLRSGKKTAAYIQYEMISGQPYVYTSDDVLFQVYAEQNGIPPEGIETAKISFFAKGQPCMRASVLTKSYGWGVHCDAEGKVALYALESDTYKDLVLDSSMQHTRAMRSKRKNKTG
ncbi:MAG: hypothetical protein KDF60_12365 [Calditrichaeota bacterium]|nr:hypothetical protein [Calditrichota bacterium]